MLLRINSNQVMHMCNCCYQSRSCCMDELFFKTSDINRLVPRDTYAYTKLSFKWKKYEHIQSVVGYILKCRHKSLENAL